MAALAWGKKVSRQFAEKVIDMSASLGIDPSWLMACMAFESGETFSASVRNNVSGATGLIQFMPTTARNMGTLIDVLASMTPEKQLDYVAQYFRPYAGRLHSLSDVYMVILWPKAVGHPDSYVLFEGQTAQYLQNRGLDLNHDGKVTKAEAAAKVQAKLIKGMQPDFCLELDADAASAEEESVQDASPPGTADVAEEASEPVPLPTARPADAPQPIEYDIVSAAAENVGRPAGEPSDYSIEYVQRRLRELNYFTVGRADGNFGGFVRGAIVRFKHDKRLHPEDSTITPELLALLHDPECAPAPISEARANATVDDIAKDNPTLWALAWQKVVALAGMIGTFFMAAFNYLYEKIGSDFYMIERIGGVVAKMPLWGWLGMASGVCLLGWALVSHGERDQVEKYRRGELL
jgi:peptidoglycan hydrolase-like protein with peptidoglycan-binding domain